MSSATGPWLTGSSASWLWAGNPVPLPGTDGFWDDSVGPPDFDALGVSQPSLRYGEEDLYVAGFSALSRIDCP